MTSVKMVDAKYIFIDIVKYSKRHAEIQYDIIEKLNNIVKNIIGLFNLSDKVKYIPTGDGMCFAVLDVNEPFDVHIQVALKILENICIYNSQKDNAGNFEVRIGINETVYIDGNDSLEDAGVNYVQLVSSFGDGGNILVGESIYNYLSQREKYESCFTKYHAVAEYDITINVYQYTNKQYGFLNNNVPEAFQKITKQKYSKVIAYFIALLIKENANIEKLISTKKESGHTLTVALFMLACQYEKNSNGGDSEKSINNLPCEEHTLEALLEYFNKIDLPSNTDYGDYIQDQLGVYGYCFEKGYFNYKDKDCFRVNQEGVQKLKEEYLDIAAELGVE